MLILVGFVQENVGKIDQFFKNIYGNLISFSRIVIYDHNDRNYFLMVQLFAII